MPDAVSHSGPDGVSVMVDPQTSRFWRAAVQSGLADADALRACWERIPEAKQTEEAMDRRLARQAVDAGLVTVWQAQQLLTGRVTGFQIDRYVLIDLIGQGGMGRVYLAKDTRLGRRVAIKVLSKERMSNPRAIARFQREAKVGAQLQHENLVRIYDEGESSGIRYLVMEHIDGRNVAHLIGKQGSIPWPEAARLCRQIALGLEHAQQKGLIHRDVNPANILVTHDGTAKLTDLGLAIDLADEANVTRDGATVGTFDYISPEQAKHSRDVDSRADIYSLGCTLFHMISGRVPFPVPSLPEKLYAHQLHEAEPLTELVPEVPEGLAEVVRRMMRKLPDDRYATPLAVAQALEPFAADAARPGSGSASGSGLRRSALVTGTESQATTLASAPAATSADVSDPELPFFAVDVGPEAPLSEGLQSRPKARPKPRPKSSTPDATEAADPPEAPAAPRPSPRLAGAGVVAIGLAVVLAAVVGIAAVVASSRKKLADRPGEVDRPRNVGLLAHETRVGKGGPASPIAVVSGDRSRSAETLAEAVQMAVGGGGDVVLSGPGPIRVASGQEARVTRGRVTIRAGSGPPPVVAVDVAAGKPLLMTTPGTMLTLKGLRIVAHYQASASPTPLIEAGGNVALNHCIVVAAGAVGGSIGVRAEGLKLAVDGCLIAGFDRAMEVASFPGSSATIEQSMIVHAGETGRPPGWAIRVRFEGGGGSKPRKLALDRVTARGGGLIEAVDFPSGTALDVALDHAAVRAQALVAWTPRAGESAEAWSKGLHWSGKGNRYEVTGGAWVVVSASGELPTPKAPEDLASWSAAVGSDKDATARPFGFASQPAEALAEPLTVEPARFALEGEAVEGVGADPKQVGPKSP